MILVRLVFQAKFGKASDLVALFKETGDVARSVAKGARHVRILTDLSGPFDTVVQELEYDSIEAFQADQAAMFSSPAFRSMGSRGTDLMTGGHKEFYTVEYDR